MLAPPASGPASDSQTDAAGPKRPSASAPRYEVGDSIGRFTVLGELGSGGMGVVLAAYDPHLDRRVAIKILRSGLPSVGGTDARARLVLEAQAMAQLRHPNVVGVFEVGQHAGEVYIAMEYVGGGTLAEFARARRGGKQGWRKIVDAYVQAGWGLVAAHEAGMVHRDFKPANVLVDITGERFQVTDFGIAQRGDSSSQGPISVSSQSLDGPPSMTSTGTLMGTAAYMAPERHRGDPASAHSDQFAFCVSLWESLHGERPHTGRNRVDVSHSILTGNLRKPPAGHGVPAWVQAALRRGMERHPGKRWPTLASLLRTLASPEEGDVGRRTRVILGVLLGLMFTIMPLLGATYGVPTDTSTYEGAVKLTLLLLGGFLAATYLARDQVRASELNRKSWAALLAVLVLQVPLEVGHAIAGVPIEESWVLHLLYWASMAGMFAALVDRRFLILAGCYFTAFLAALARPDLYSVISSVNNAAFIACAVLIWRRSGGAPLESPVR